MYLADKIGLGNVRFGRGLDHDSVRVYKHRPQFKESQLRTPDR